MLEDLLYDDDEDDNQEGEDTNTADIITANNNEGEEEDDNAAIDESANNKMMIERKFNLDWMRDSASSTNNNSSAKGSKDGVVTVEDLEAIEDKIDIVHKEVLQLYSVRFPEIGSLVPNPISLAHVVKRIGNSAPKSSAGTSVNSVTSTSYDFTDLLPSAQALVVSVSAATTNGTSLTQENYETCIGKCDKILELENERIRLLGIIESKIQSVAPNVSALIGPGLAAQLVGFAGGLNELANSPSSNVQLYGKNLVTSRLNRTGGAMVGLGAKSTMKNVGILHYSDLVQSANPEDRTKALRVISGKVVLAARLDMSKKFRDGSSGESWRKEIENKVNKWKEPGQGKMKKPLPLPDAEYKKRRGGKRARALKKRLGITEMGKEMDRTKFGTGEDDEYGDSAMGRTFGMLGKDGTGKIKIGMSDRKILKDGPPTKKLKGGRVFKPFQPSEF